MGLAGCAAAVTSCGGLDDGLPGDGLPGDGAARGDGRASSLAIGEEALAQLDEVALGDCGGTFGEVLPLTEAPVQDLRFSGNVATFVDDALTRRAPFGLELVQGARRESPQSDCPTAFTGTAASAPEIFHVLDVAVHECGHVYDLELSRGSGNVYVLNSELRYECDRGDTTSRSGDTFARSRILTDGLQPQLPPCTERSQRLCDRYASTYLDGDPDDGRFQGGDQGYNMLLEEAVQYVNSIAIAWAFADQRPRFVSVSARDGILTFFWYIERYLRLARSEYPQAYARIAEDDCWRNLTLAVWARGWTFLRLAREAAGLGIDAESLEALVTQPELLAEIERLRPFEDCL